MTKAIEVLSMLCPDTEFTIIGEDYKGITWHSGEAKITKKQFDAGFAQYEEWKAEQDAAQLARKSAAQAKLTALGLTVEDLTALGL